MKHIETISKKIDGHTRYNFVDDECKYLCKQWFTDVYEFEEEGVFIVRLDGKYAIFNLFSKTLCNQWFDEIWGFRNHFLLNHKIYKYSPVKLGDKWNWVDTNGNILFPNKWFDKVLFFENGYAQVKLNDRGWNFIDTNGYIASPNLWFDDCDDFDSDNLARVKKDDKWNFIENSGELLCPNQWFDYCGRFFNGVAMIETDNKKAWIDINGKIISEI